MLFAATAIATRPLFIMGIGQQPIRFFPAFLWAEIVGVFEVDGIYTGERDELFKINVLVGFDLEAVELLFSDLAR